MTTAKPPIRYAKVIFIVTAAFLATSFAQAQAINPAQKQEYTDAKSELDTALKSQASKYSPAELKLAQESLQAADNALATQNTVKFSQFTRLARAQAQLAISLADLGAESDKSSGVSLDLQKAKNEIAAFTFHRHTSFHSYCLVTGFWT